MNCSIVTDNSVYELHATLPLMMTGNYKSMLCTSNLVTHVYRQI